MLGIRKYTWVLHIATIAICAYFVAQGVSTYVASLLDTGTPPTTVRQAKGVVAPDEEVSLEVYQVIAERNIFDSSGSAVATEEAASEETEELTPGELGPAVKTSLDITLGGTLVIGDGLDRRSSALISSGKAKEGKVYFVGDAESFSPNVKITKVEKNRIEFMNGNKLEFAELEDGSKEKSIFASRDEVFGKGKGELDKNTADVAKPEGAEGGEEGPIVVDQKEINSALANLDQLYSEVRLVPNFSGGQSKGLKLLSVKPGSLVSKLGIRRGDVLEKINGEELDIKRGMELFTQLKDLKNFSMDIVRGGKNKTLAYEIR